MPFPAVADNRELRNFRCSECSALKQQNLEHQKLIAKLRQEPGRPCTQCSRYRKQIEKMTVMESENQRLKRQLTGSTHFILWRSFEFSNDMSRIGELQMYKEEKQKLIEDYASQIRSLKEQLKHQLTAKREVTSLWGHV